MPHDPDPRPTDSPAARPDGYEPPRVERVLKAEDLEREVMTGGPLASPDV